MMCYMDRTFCPFRECRFFDCCPFDRALTDKRKADAIAWWGPGSDPPISVFIDRPECFKARNAIVI